jgi:nitrate/TMAO reductase-like tetraheme cytochrome c subunit
MKRQIVTIFSLSLGLTFSCMTAQAIDYQAAIWHPLHFKPAIETATNEQCLACHQEILESKVKPVSPAGIKASDSLAWYQTLDIYDGEQETFHRRHLVTPLAQNLMNLQCNTCHEGHDPREEAPNPPSATDAGFTLRKTVNPETTCLKCHGQMDYHLMGMPGPWEQTKQIFQNCTTCHAAIRTVRHQVNYLNAEAIEAAALDNPDTCYGCHGGRAWYRIAYPYPRHFWPGAGTVVPDWAKDRPQESAPRFRLSEHNATE